jgi:hypothetical protein
MEKPITPLLPGSPVSDGPTGRQRWISILAAVLLAVIGGLVILAWPSDDDSPATPTDGESAAGTLGGAPVVAGTTGPAPSGGVNPNPGASASGGVDPSASASPGLSASASPGPTARTGSFEVTSRVTKGLLGSSAEITIRNTGSTASVWHSVMVKTNGSGVSTSDPSVSYSPQGGEHCFVPSDGNLAAGASFVFTVSVSGVLPDVTATPLDTPPCPA